MGRALTPGRKASTRASTSPCASRCVSRTRDHSAASCKCLTKNKKQNIPSNLCRRRYERHKVPHQVLRLTPLQPRTHRNSTPGSTLHTHTAHTRTHTHYLASPTHTCATIATHARALPDRPGRPRMRDLVTCLWAAWPAAQGAIILATGGDNSNAAEGKFADAAFSCKRRRKLPR